MATTTIHGHVTRALDFMKKPDLFVVIGKSTPWPNDNIPPMPDPSTTTVSEIIGYRKIDTVLAVIPDEEGEIRFKGDRYRIVQTEHMYTVNARHVYVSTTIAYEELPLVSYREVGIVSGLRRAEGVLANKLALLPSEVAFGGYLEVLDYRKTINRESDLREQVGTIIEF